MMFIAKSGLREFRDLATPAHRMRSHARSLNLSRAGSLYRRMRVFSYDSDALGCARQVPCRYPAAYGTLLHQPEHRVPQTPTKSSLPRTNFLDHRELRSSISFFSQCGGVPC